MKMTRQEVYNLIDHERAYQDGRWGGPEHDATHDVFEWISFISDRADMALRPFRTAQSAEHREFCRVTLRKIAALAVAGLEVHGAPDRQVDHTPEAP